MGSVVPVPLYNILTMHFSNTAVMDVDRLCYLSPPPTCAVDQREKPTTVLQNSSQTNRQRPRISLTFI